MILLEAEVREERACTRFFPRDCVRAKSVCPRVCYVRTHITHFLIVGMMGAGGTRIRRSAQMEKSAYSA